MSTEAPDPEPFEARQLHEEDLALVRAALSGDDAAIQFLAERTRIIPRVLATLNRRWGKPLTEQDIEDLAQDIALFVLQKLDGYQGLSPFDAWLYRFCSFQLRNRVRREVFRRKVVTTQEAEPIVQRDPGDKIDGEDVWNHVDDLGETDGEIIRAKHARDLSFTEIGEQLGMSSSTIKSRYYRSLDRLRLRVRQPGRRS